MRRRMTGIAMRVGLTFVVGAVFVVPVPAGDSAAGDAEDVDALFARFDKGDVEAAAALVKLGAAAAPPLVFRLVGSDAKLAASAADALSAIGEPALAPLRDEFGGAGNAAKTTIRAALARVAESAHVGGAFRGDRMKRGGLGATGASIQTEKAVAAALDWLARHQAIDGSWSCDGFGAACKGSACGGGGDKSFARGVTGLALLCFFGAGENSQSGAHKDSVVRGLDYLGKAVAADGCVGPRPAHSSDIYNHAIATLALCEEAMLTQDPEAVERARRAVAFVLAAQNSGLGWRYSVPSDGDNDTSVTGWMAYVLALARAAKIADVPAKALHDAATWIDKMTEPEYGRTGYQYRGSPSSRLLEATKKFPADGVETLTAIGVMIRLFDDHTLKEDGAIQKGWGLIQRKPPKWGASGLDADFYGWFWEATAVRQLGPPLRPWSGALKEALLGRQRSGATCAAGSWDPADAWSSMGGRVYSTAMCCLSLQSHFRMDQMPNAK